jgi:galactokinase
MINNTGNTQKLLQIKNLFNNFFGNSENTSLIISPASIMLHGDHTHYNEGLIISAALDKYWMFLIRKRNDTEINIVSAESNSMLKIKLDDNKIDETESFKLLQGLIELLKEKKLLNKGFDCVISSTVPACLGLGSFAAQQVGFIFSLNKIFSFNIEETELLKLIRRNELNLIGKISNIGHHYTARYARGNKLFYMDIRDSSYKSISCKENNCSLVICDSGIVIDHPEETCNERINECEIGVKGLKLYIWGIRSLRDVKMDFLQKHIHVIPRTIYNRVLYNVKERVLAEESLSFIRKKSFREFGSNIIQSHCNLSTDYNLQNEVFDFLVSEALKVGDAYCAKMINCSPIRSTFNIVPNDKVESFVKSVSKSFENNYHKELRTYVTQFSGGVKKISSKELELSLN